MTTVDRDILIVDDNHWVAEAIADGVRVAGYTVCGIASSVEEAVALTRERQPRLAVVDVDLGPGEDGVEAARKLLKLGPIGIIFVTGYPDKIRATDVGLAWLEKPYRVLDLINALDVVDALNQDRPVTGRVPPELHLIQRH
jgi:two-component system, response regulator PdtaR